MATAGKLTLHDEVQNAWKSAVHSFESLKKDGKVSQDQWDKLHSFDSPQDLLKDIQNAPYATTQNTKKLLRLAEASVDSVLRFDNEIANIAQGISSSSFGIASAAWGALRVVLHISQDIFKSPDVLIELITKIFVFMPRIDIYFELFHDQKDILDIQSLLVLLYKLIIDFNIKAISWYSSSKGRKFAHAFREDPRAQFQEILKKMSDTSEEMEKRVEAMNIKAQMSRHREMLHRFLLLEKAHQQHMDEVRDIIIAKNEENMKQVMATYLEDLKEQQRQVDITRVEAAEKEKRKREELLRPYNKLSQIRESLWRVLHKAPWTVVTESSISDHDVSCQEPQPSSWQFWDNGKYASGYPIEDSLGDITLLVDWKAMSGLEIPLFRWMISVPNSIYYPGQHFGRLELKKSSRACDKTDFDVIDSRLRIKWESPIFSPLPSIDEAFLSSIGPLEEKCAPLVLTSALQSIAHHLIHGPFPTSFAYPLPWHHMNGKIDRYLNRKTNNQAEEGMRVTAFFANAFTRDLEGLDDFGDIPLHPDCREASIMAIQELMEFYKIEDHMGADADFQDVRGSYGEIYTQQEWVQEDRQWALRIAELAGLKHLATAAKQFTTVKEMSRGFETASHAQLESGESSLLKTSNELPPPPEPRKSLAALQMRENPGPLGEDRLPKDWSSLHRAVWREDLNTVMALANESTVETLDDSGYTPLHLACSHSESSLFIFRQILDRGLKARITASWTEGHLCLPSRRNSQSAALQMTTVLIEAGADVNAEASRARPMTLPWTPMHCVASSGWIEVAHLLLEKGGSAFSANMCSPFCWAADSFPGHGSGQTMKELLKLHVSDEQMKEIEALHER